MTTKTQQLGARDLAVAVAMNLVWGLNIIAVKMSVGVTGPFTVGLLRLGIVALVCLPALRIVPGRMRWLALLGVSNGALFLCVVNLSLTVTDNVGALAIAGQLSVPFALILAILFLGERVHWPRIMGMTLAFAGVAAMLFDPGVVREAGGIALTALGALVWAAGALVQRRLAGVPVLTIYAWLGLVGALAMLPLAIAFEPGELARVPEMRLGALGWILFSALGSTLIGQGGMAWLLARHPVGVVSPLTLAAPVIAVGASSLFFDTPLTRPMIAGGVMAIAGVAVIVVRSAREPR